MLAKTKERAYNASLWSGSSESFESLKQIFPRAYRVGNEFCVDTECGLVQANIGDFVVATDTMIMVLSKPQFDELFTLDF